MAAGLGLTMAGVVFVNAQTANAKLAKAAPL